MLLGKTQTDEQAPQNLEAFEKTLTSQTHLTRLAEIGGDGDCHPFEKTLTSQTADHQVKVTVQWDLDHGYWLGAINGLAVLSGTKYHTMVERILQAGNSWLAEKEKDTTNENAEPSYWADPAQFAPDPKYPSTPYLLSDNVRATDWHYGRWVDIGYVKGLKDIGRSYVNMQTHCMIHGYIQRGMLVPPGRMQVWDDVCRGYFDVDGEDVMVHEKAMMTATKRLDEAALAKLDGNA